MRPARHLLASALAALAWLGCSDDPAGPPSPLAPPPDSPELILSNPIAPGAGAVVASTTGAGLASVAYLSLPPGTVPGAEFVLVRNLTDGASEEMAVRVVNGGFDPVVIVAAAGDRLQLEFYGEGAVLGRKHGTVPRSRPPTIVRIAPPQGRTDVALGVRPLVIFSEPMDPASLAPGIMLLRAEAAVEGQIASLPTAPWAAEFAPASPLEPGAMYALDIAVAVRDVEGEPLSAAVRSEFTTGTAASPPPDDPPGPPVDPPPPAPAPNGPGRLAFTSNRDGRYVIHLAEADGSGVRVFVEGYDPAWSWDGRRLSFTREGRLFVIEADGSGERELPAQGAASTWSTDDRKLAYLAAEGIETVELETGERSLLLRHDQLGPGIQLAWPAWSPTGAEIAFVAYNQDPPTGFGRVWVMGADGSNPRPVADGDLPAWSPDGRRIAFSALEASGSCPPYQNVIASVDPDAAASRSVHYRAPCDLGWVTIASYPAWAPDGTRIAFTRDFHPEGAGVPGRILVVDVATGVASQLIPDAGPEIPPDYWDVDVAWSRVMP